MWETQIVANFGNRDPHCLLVAGEGLGPTRCAQQIDLSKALEVTDDRAVRVVPLVLEDLGAPQVASRRFSCSSVSTGTGTSDTLGGFIFTMGESVISRSRTGRQTGR